MKIIKNDNVVCFDVDETLIYNSFARTNLKINNYYVIPIREHIDLLKQYYEEGKVIVVWSAGGYKWVQSVCKALDITKYVTLMMGKPFQYVDDLDANDWMNRVYLL